MSVIAAGSFLSSGKCEHVLLPIKLQRVAAMLDCTPTISGIGEVLARRLLYHGTDDVDEILDRYVCRLCHFSADNQKDFHEHLVEKHRGAGDESRALIEYRKKVIGLLEHMGPDVSWLQSKFARLHCLICCDRVPRILKNVYWKQNCLSNAS